ncbi:hypothetical protein ACQVGZ_01675 [Enterococcus lactis]
MCRRRDAVGYVFRPDGSVRDGQSARRTCGVGLYSVRHRID